MFKSCDDGDERMKMVTTEKNRVMLSETVRQIFKKKNPESTQLFLN